MPRDRFYQFYDSTQTRDIGHLCSGYLFFTQHSCSHVNQVHQYENMPIERITDYFKTSTQRRSTFFFDVFTLLLP